MRRARGLRVTSSRDICIFCATRQLAIADILSIHSTPSQRRHLNSSSRTPQSVEAVFYKDAKDAPEGMSQAERMRQQLAASTPPAAPAAQGTYMSPAQRMRAALASQAPPQRAPPPPPPRQSANRGSMFEGLGRGQRDAVPPRQPASRSANMFEGLGARSQPPVRRPPASNGTVPYNPPSASQNRFRVNMVDSRPAPESPGFRADFLRREQAPPPVASAAQRAPPKRKLLDEAELAKLLGNDVNMKKKMYQPLARDGTAQRKCWHCGSTEHASHTCGVKPVLRERGAGIERGGVDRGGERGGYQERGQFQDRGGYQARGQFQDRGGYQERGQSQDRAQDRGGYQERGQFQNRGRYQDSDQPESIADAANKWSRTEGASLDYARPPTVQEEADKKAQYVGQDRSRRGRTETDQPESYKNRYEQPERRRGYVKGRRMERDDDDDERVVNRSERKKMRQEAKKAAQEAKKAPTPIYLPQYISVANLASMLKMRAEDFVVKLHDLGFEDVQNDHILNAEHAGLVAQEYNFDPIFQGEEQDGDLYPAPAVSDEAYIELPARPPVVTIMGHVDHGKTTILDYMRSTSVAATEFGGITQHIGAFSVPLANGKKITFLDTPGHSAFETMRARGANVTDIVVLVVAADDSVMPQTIEAIKHAQTAKVPMIVAINKIDKGSANIEAVKLDLGRHGIEIEDFGGDVQAVGVSGKTGQGIPDLEEAISTLSELLDHRADPTTKVEGWVLEGTTKKSGRVATVLVRSGTLRQGTALVAGTTWTRVRSLRNEAGVVVPEAGPGIAVEVDGWRDQPIAGDEVLQAADEQQAAAVTKLRVDKVEREQMARDMSAINESRRLEAARREAEAAAERALAEGIEEDPSTEVAAPKESGPEVVSFIIKGDVSGSVEAVIDSVAALGNGEVSTRILRHGVGPPSEFDVQHAADAGGHIVNFNTSIPAHVARLAEDKGVKILDSNIIYRVVENVKELLSAKLAPAVIQKVSGEADIAAVFSIKLSGRNKLLVAGSKVRHGLVERGSKVRVLRGDEEVIYTGTIGSIKNQKKDVEQMRKDTECGISFDAWEGFQIGDRIQCFEERFEKRSL